MLTIINFVASLGTSVIARSSGKHNRIRPTRQTTLGLYGVALEPRDLAASFSFYPGSVTPLIFSQAITSVLDQNNNAFDFEPNGTSAPTSSGQGIAGVYGAEAAHAVTTIQGPDNAAGSSTQEIGVYDTEITSDEVDNYTDDDVTCPYNMNAMAQSTGGESYSVSNPTGQQAIFHFAYDYNEAFSGTDAGNFNSWVWFNYQDNYFRVVGAIGNGASGLTIINLATGTGLAVSQGVTYDIPVDMPVGNSDLTYCYNSMLNSNPSANLYSPGLHTHATQFTWDASYIFQIP